MVRTILTWRILGEDLVGTCHVPTPGRAGGLAGVPSVGVLLLNSGAALRSGNSDLSARIGDRLALRGFPVFRFDLSGLGDSSGPTPVDLAAFWDEVVEGRNDEATVALIERIQLEFGVARVLVGGLCAAALPAIRAAAGARAAPAGLILLEPNFRRVAGRPGAGIAGPGQRSTPEPEREWRLARAARPLGSFLRDVLQRVAGATLPRDVNAALLSRWQESLEHEVRSLVVVAAEQGNDRYVARVLASMPDLDPGLVTCVRVPETNHLFTGGNGRDALLAALERWVIQFSTSRAARSRRFDRLAETRGVEEKRSRA